MVSKGTYLIPSDKCGVWFVNVFHLYGGFSRKSSKFGNFVKVSVRKTKPNNWLSKKQKRKAIIIRTLKEIKKNDGSYVYFNFNNCVLLKRRTTPEGKEVYGPILKNIRRRKFITSFPGII